ncbi:uncharacterized protein [Branchiostoma lanceolatum]|uniref:uncharacterized protein n=1 Tax=Branchiostoma lanceolatum TaxID=7740 RepID=UPI003452DF30
MIWQSSIVDKCLIHLAGTPVSDTVCGPCPDGTFSNRESLTKCRTWRNCTAMGMKTIRNGTSIRNARCEPFPTTSTSSQTVAPALRVNSTSNSASTATTATYRSTYTTAAPTTSTMHSSTSAAKPPVQQTTDESESPATVSVSPPPSDNNPEADGGNGPNHHDNKAQVATAVVVGLIAFVLIVLLLLGIGNYFRKWQQRRRWQRRPDYRSFPLPEDEDLQAGDLERRQQVPKDNVGRAGHVRRTTATDVTPGDNTGPHEIESLIQSGGGTLPHDTEAKGAVGPPAISITDVHLAKLPEVMPTNWKRLGMKHFQIRTQDVDRIITKHPFERDLQIVEMFKLWTGREGKAAKLCNLCQKLNEAGIEWKVLCELFSEEETQTKALVN